MIGGAERVLYEQSTRLANRGHSVHILTRKLDKHKKYRKTCAGVTEWRYKYNPNNHFSFIFTTLKNAKNLFEQIHDRYAFDCLNLHQPFSALGVIYSNLSAPIAKIYTCHSLSFEEYISRNGNSLHFFSRAKNYIQSRGHKKIERNILKKSNEIVALSQFTKEKIINIHQILEKKIKVVPGGVNLKKFSPTADKSQIRKRLNIPINKIILFTVRNLVSRMGLENLIIASNDLIKQNAEINIVIGGEGPLKTGLIALARSFGIEDHIHFVGFVPEDQLLSYYQMADLFVLPTKELEGFGLVTLEALASGCPVVGTPVGGTKEILGKFDSSFLFKGTDPESMAELITDKCQLIKRNPQKWLQIARQCRKFAERNYSWEKNIDSLEKLIAKTLPN